MNALFINSQEERKKGQLSCFYICSTSCWPFLNVRKPSQLNMANVPPKGQCVNSKKKLKLLIFSISSAATK